MQEVLLSSFDSAKLDANAGDSLHPDFSQQISEAVAVTSLIEEYAATFEETNPVDIESRGDAQAENSDEAVELATIENMLMGLIEHESLGLFVKDNCAPFIGKEVSSKDLISGCFKEELPIVRKVFQSLHLCVEITSFL